MTTTNDSRFFPGYVWVSDQADCRRGLCIRGATAAEAVGRWLELDRSRYHWLRGKPVTVWTLASAAEAPVRHDLVR